MGNYIKLINQCYEDNLISDGMREELLKDSFNEDLINDDGWLNDKNSYIPNPMLEIITFKWSHN